VSILKNENKVKLGEKIEDEYENIAGVCILKNGEKVYEEYFNGFSPEDTVHIMSVTKSIISALIGIAIDKGYIKSPDQKVLDFFPDYTVKRGEKTIQNVTIKNMLTMTAPYKYKSEPFSKVYGSDDWTKAALDLLGGKEGITGEFKYSTVGTQILSGILVNSTGKSVIEFASENLFVPLKIKIPDNTFIRNIDDYMNFIKNKKVKGWAADPSRMNTAGWGLTLTPYEMAKIGQLFLNKGLWEGKRIISSEWIEESTKEQSKWGVMKYGYLWWIIDQNSYAALGDGGNVIYVNSDSGTVVAVTSLFMPKFKDRIEFIKKYIEPVV